MRQLLLILTLLCTPIRVPDALAQPDRVRIGGSYVLSVLPLVAHEQGIFAKHGLDVQFEHIAIGKLAMDALISGSIDFAIVVDTNLAMNSFRDSSLRAIASVLDGYDNGIAFRRTPGRSTFTHLKGKRIGYVPATTSHFLLLSLLSSEGWTLSDIQAVPMQPTTMLPALRSGSVDAVSIWNPFRFQIMKALSDTIGEQLAGSHYRAKAYLATDLKLLVDKPGVARRMLEALIEAEGYVKTHSDQVRTRYAAWNGMDEESLRSVWSTMSYRLALSADSMNTVVRDIELIRRHDPAFTAQTPRALTEVFAAAPLKALAPDRVDELPK